MKDPIVIKTHVSLLSTKRSKSLHQVLNSILEGDAYSVNLIESFVYPEPTKCARIHTMDQVEEWIRSKKLRRGDFVWSYEGYRNENMWMYNGIELEDLSTELDEYGHLPSWRSYPTYDWFIYKDTIGYNQIQWLEHTQDIKLQMMENIEAYDSPTEEMSLTSFVNYDVTYTITMNLKLFRALEVIAEEAVTWALFEDPDPFLDGYQAVFFRCIGYKTKSDMFFQMTSDYD